MNQPDPQSRSFEGVMSSIRSGTLKIPQFQREFVWPREKSAKLIDSILKGFPIGTFILWNRSWTVSSDSRASTRPAMD